MSILTRVPRSVYDRNRDAFDAFNPATEYSDGTARAMAWLAQLAYETEEPGKIAEILAGWNLAPAGGVIACNDRAALPTAETRGFVAHGRGATFVAFAGTDPALLANWTTNFDLLPVAGGISRGFRDAAAIALDDVLDRFGATDPTNRLFVTGHSLGGALAVLTALALARCGHVPDAVYTQGMPRPGNAAFAEGYNAVLGDRTYRLVYGDDLVPTVPPGGLGYRHVGRYLRCDRGGSFSGLVPDPDTSVDAPLFTDGVRKDWDDALYGIAHPVEALTRQVAPTIRVLFGAPSDAGRTDTIGALIELLPPRLRDHMPDRYCSAFA